MDTTVMTRDELLPWHEAAWAQVLRARAAGRLPHALLLCGRAGIGKRHFALSLGRALLCRASRDNGLACGQCSACVLLAAGTHPDLRLCEVEFNEKTGKERSAIMIEQVRDIVDYLALKPHFDGARIVIIDQAERMNPSAANALLKTLEEPPPGTLLILASVRPAALPGTILSRCQRVLFQPQLKEAPGRDAAVAWLASRVGASHAPDLLLDLAGGAPLAAVALAGAGRLERRQAMFDDLRGLASGQADPVQVAENWLKFGLQESLYWLYTWLVDMVRLKAAEEPPFLGNPDLGPALAALAADLETRSLIGQLERIIGALRDADGQVSPQLLLEDALLGWVSLNKT
jgi:DNA polymerase III subunit delta'